MGGLEKNFVSSFPHLSLQSITTASGIRERGNGTLAAYEILNAALIETVISQP